MNLYEAIFVRRSVRQFRMETVAQSELRKIAAFYEEITPLVAGIRTEIGITDNVAGKGILKGFFGVRAPYYLTIYSEPRDRAEMNAGYIGEQICLYMTTLGLGSCFLGASVIADAPKERAGKRLMLLIAFGYPKGSLTRRKEDAKRLPMSQIATCKERTEPWVTQVIEAARMAPSSMNQQPWYFVAGGRRIHIICRKSYFGKLKRLDEINIGILCSHIAIASDELWLDLDLIRLENIVQKNFRNNQYIISAVARITDWEKNSESGKETPSESDRAHTSGILSEEALKGNGEETAEGEDTDHLQIDLDVSEDGKERIRLRRIP